MTALRTHYAEISKHFDGADGSLTVEAVARRSGIMRYRSDSGDRLELVPPDLIDARDESGRPIMGMLAGAPNTNEHPAQVIRYSTDSRKAVQVGKVSEEIHIYSDADGERSVKVRFDVSDPETIADIRNGRKTGVSLGYLCNVVPEIGEYRGQPYTHRQAMPFSIDHLAIVANPRNPGAIITRFDSDDVAWLSDESKPNSVVMPIVRVDACCAACDGQGKPGCSDDIEPDEPKTKKKKVKTDADEDLPTIPVAFLDQVHELPLAQAEALWSDGTIDLIRLDGRDYFVSADLAQGFATEGLIHEDAFVEKAGVKKGGGKCGRGWVGVKGSCKRGKPEGQQAAVKEFALKQRGERYGVTVNPSPQQKKKMAKAKAGLSSKQEIANKPENAKKEAGGGLIKSQKAFSDEALKAAKELDRDFGMDNLIPIHKLREKMGERVSRSQFSDWLNEMNAQDKVTLIGGEMPSITPEIAANSVKTMLGAPRYYLKIPKAKTDAKDLLIPTIALRNDGIVGGACGPGWEGTRGNCKRKKRSAKQIAKTVGKVALAVGALGAAAYIGNKIAKNPKKSAALGAAAIGAGVLLRRKAVAKSREADLNLYRKNLAKVPESTRKPQSTASTGKRRLPGASNRTSKSKEASLKLMQKNLEKASEANRNESLDRMRKGVARTVQDNPQLAIKKAQKTEAIRKRRLSKETMSDLIGKKEEIEESPMGWEAKLKLQALNASQARIREERSRGAKETATEVPLFSF